MAAYNGKDGYVAIAGSTVAYIDTWSLNSEIGTAEVTGFGDGAKAYVSTLKGHTMSWSGTLDRSDTDQAALMDQFEDGTLASIAMRLYTQSANYWSGSVKMTGMTVNSQVGDKVAVTFNGTVDGELSYT